MPTSTLNPQHPLSPSELSYLHQSLSSQPPIRPDGRSPTTFRPLIAETSLLPNTYGSSRVCFSDGSECIVGVKGEIEKTSFPGQTAANGEEDDEGDGTEEEERKGGGGVIVGGGNWVELSIDIPGSRDDDAGTAFLGSMIHEAIVADGMLKRRLWINGRWHWRLFVDILLLSPPTTLPLPLLSFATHLALLDTVLPAPVSTGEEDPLFNDDWDASIPLYTTPNLSAAALTAPMGKGKKAEPIPSSTEINPTQNTEITSTAPPITLLLISVGPNIFFDPSPPEILVAESLISISITSPLSSPPPSTSSPSSLSSSGIQITSLRTLPPPSQLAPSAPEAPPSGFDDGSGEGTGSDMRDQGDGLWRTPAGGMKRGVVKEMMRLVTEGGVGKEVLDGLEKFSGR